MLTRREFEVYMLIVEWAYSSKSIAKALGMSRETARCHRRVILAKMNVASALELLVQYHRREAA